MAGVKNVRKSVIFYSKLGLKPAMASSFYAEFLLPGGTAIGLHGMEEREKGRSGRNSGQGWSIMVRVKDLKRWTSRLKLKKVKCSPIRKAPGGADFSSVRDPDGNRLVFLEMPG
jgi:catechol 2,3-dioxygenase-like lactoylglutathione lyase family enzyme